MSEPVLEKDNFRGHTLKMVNVHFQILIIFWMQLIHSFIHNKLYLQVFQYHDQPSV
jgi:hypothetical protein